MPANDPVIQGARSSTDVRLTIFFQQYMRFQWQGMRQNAYAFLFFQNNLDSKGLIEKETGHNLSPCKTCMIVKDNMNLLQVSDRKLTQKLPQFWRY